MADTLSERLVTDTYTLLVDNKLFFLIFILKRYDYALKTHPVFHMNYGTILQVKLAGMMF
jgi:hypothetical protein